MLHGQVHRALRDLIFRQGEIIYRKLYLIKSLLIVQPNLCAKNQKSF